MMSRFPTRRRFLSFSALAPAGSALGSRRSTLALLSEDRQCAALAVRENAARAQSAQPQAPHIANGDETAFPGWIAACTKGLPHTQLGEVEPGAYETLLRAIESG